MGLSGRHDFLGWAGGDSVDPMGFPRLEHLGIFGDHRGLEEGGDLSGQREG